MSLSRRKFISLLGGGVVVAAVVPAATLLSTRTPYKALQPWNTAGSYDDPRLDAMSYALLAPNPHNRQPWLVELVGSDSVWLTRDLTRDLPVTDPFGRQLTIGMGCFIELMRMAAAEKGFKVESTLLPDGEEGAFTREAASDPDNPDSRDAIESTANAILSAPAITLTVTDGNMRKDQLEAERQWFSLNLKTTSLGMAIRPVSQALQ